MLSFMLSVIYAECHKSARYGECHYAECRYTECCYAEYSGAKSLAHKYKTRVEVSGHTS